MTTIAYDSRYLSADRQMGGSFTSLFRKMHLLHDGSIAACAGQVSDAQAFYRWYDEGADIDCWPSAIDNLNAIVVNPDGTVTYYDEQPCVLDFTGQLVAVGSGAEFALGAMHAGKSSSEAVAIAAKLDANTGMGVDTLDTRQLQGMSLRARRKRSTGRRG